MQPHHFFSSHIPKNDTRFSRILRTFSYPGMGFGIPWMAEGNQIIKHMEGAELIQRVTCENCPGKLYKPKIGLKLHRTKTKCGERRKADQQTLHLVVDSAGSQEIGRKLAPPRPSLDKSIGADLLRKCPSYQQIPSPARWQIIPQPGPRSLRVTFRKIKREVHSNHQTLI